MKKVALWLVLSLPCSALAQDAKSPWQTVVLDNGAAIHAIQVEDAPVTSVFSFLPMGLQGDPAGRTQFAHLAEHMMIRSTDPDRMRLGELNLNGETTNQAMRLESYGPHERVAEMLERHAKWLTVRSFNAETLPREKVMVISELKATVPYGHNHKWATAAWSQFVQGRDHAAVQGDVENVSMAQLEEYVASHVDLSKAHIFVCGAGDAAEQIATLKKEFGKILVPQAKKEQVPVSSGPVPSEPVLSKPFVEARPGHREVTWASGGDLGS